MIQYPEQADCFMHQGYAIFQDRVDLIDLDRFDAVNVETSDEILTGRTDEEVRMLHDFVEYITKTYVEPMFPLYQIVHYGVWDGVDDGSMCWHNDSDECFDFNMLFYYDTQTPDTGGAIQFRWPGGEKTVYPTAGTIAFINQGERFEHKANRSAVKRRVASIEYRIL